MLKHLKARLPLTDLPDDRPLAIAELHDEDGDYPALTWLRLPPGSRHTPRAGERGAMLYVKEGHIGAQWLALP